MKIVFPRKPAMKIVQREEIPVRASRTAGPGKARGEGGRRDTARDCL